MQSLDIVAPMYNAIWLKPTKASLGASIDESEDETEESDTCDEFDDGDDMDFFASQD
ncbi:hypothetical protein RvY_09097 [Ramazzottius varieornatus]|uniref:Uncharacterized protein n=1 Tax=Ramazzottius varieornatus TaxID=947166 RepID=A0A1D1V844_RAMVA|nr:hypothetical protein RvY_09097 [Ramazzottius varieornatus]